MSHIVTIQTKVQDSAAITAACRRLGLPAPVHGKARLYSGEVSGWIVQLPGWTYPAVIDTASGSIHFDNFGGSWGEEAHLQRYLQMYAIEKCRLEAQKRGYQVTEQTLQNGSIKLQIIEGG